MSRCILVPTPARVNRDGAARPVRAWLKWACTAGRRRRACSGHERALLAQDGEAQAGSMPWMRHLTSAVSRCGRGKRNTKSSRWERLATVRIARSCHPQRWASLAAICGPRTLIFEVEIQRIVTQQVLQPAKLSDFALLQRRFGLHNCSRWRACDGASVLAREPSSTCMSTSTTIHRIGQGAWAWNGKLY